jgi:hypothetical protein
VVDGVKTPRWAAGGIDPLRPDLIALLQQDHCIYPKDDVVTAGEHDGDAAANSGVAGGTQVADLQPVLPGRDPSTVYVPMQHRPGHRNGVLAARVC